MFQLMIPKCLQNGWNAAVSLAHIGEFVDNNDELFLPRKIGKAGKDILPIGKSLEERTGIAKGEDAFGKLHKLLFIRRFSTGIKKIGFVFAKFGQKLGLSDAAPAIQDDKFSFWGMIMLIQKLQLLCSSDKHGQPQQNLV